MTHLPAHFVRTIIDIHEEEGEAWLASFPQFLASVAERYELRLGEPFALSYNYVCAATRRDGTPVVLKLSPPNREFYTEVAALRHYSLPSDLTMGVKSEGKNRVEGCVEVLEADPDAGILIMERVLPGTPLRDLPDDEEATRIMADVMSKLWRPLPAGHNFPTVAKWAQGLQRLRDDYQGSTGPLPADLVERAEATYRELLASAPPPVLLHGDLHHENILAATRVPYLAIDPKGLAGEPAYEVGPLFYNPIGVDQWPNLRQVFERRLAILGEHLPFERERLLACAFAHCVLSAAWSVEDHGDGWQGTVYIAKTLLQL